eukprot:2890058-Prymnesium_polylepis.1
MLLRSGKQSVIIFPSSEVTVASRAPYAAWPRRSKSTRTMSPTDTVGLTVLLKRPIALAAGCVRKGRLGRTSPREKGF